MVWNDRNHDGVSDKGELRSLSAAGIEKISLEVFGRTDLNPSLSESQVLGQSAVIFSDGRVTTAFDVALHSEPLPRSCGCSSSASLEYWQLIV
ncbi:MAG: hypothetical protein AVDCRST_MAG93-2764 [uncultured Chloroflexia bacterium]|uniref:Uncharacterized protein n=1 Tax=uncultured Chloroflexia bacterium TaxID=1672391 RepID=A0A6J4J8Y8_9CHLR|nr:MAG: hypothetical protein AVDCRST_MAG93-2764 [uncultured Chloroflexia bacterium]